MITARLLGPVEIVRGVDTLAQCRLERDGAVVVPSAPGSLVVVRPDGSTLATFAAPAVGSVATAIITGASTAGQALGERWRARWSVPTADGAVTPEVDAVLVRAQLYPVVTQSDLIARRRSLDPASPLALTREANFQYALSEAWEIVRQRLISRGKRPWLVMSPTALREVHILQTLALIFDDMAGSAGSAEATAAETYREHLESEWARMTLVYDVDGDGVSDGGRVGVSGPLWLGRSRAGRGDFWVP